ncbi:hypothetical protein ACVCAH_11600 [Micromonospora sp. LZ34]
MLPIIAAAEEPKVTDWMQGWSGIAGVVIGLLAAIFTGLLLLYEIRAGRRIAREAAQDRAEAAQDREFARAERRDAEAQQARTVVISDVGLALGADGTLGRLTLFVANYGHGPVLDVEVDLIIEHDNEIHTRLMARGVLGPQEQLPFDGIVQAPNGGRIQFPLAADVLAESVRIEVTFTDMAGIRWRRRDSQQPERIVD